VLVVSFPTSPSSSKTDFVCIFYRVFEFGGFTGSFLKEVFTSSYLLFYLSLLLGFYGLHWIDIFLSFSKSPSLLKSESGCESYRIFCEDFFCRFRARFGPEIQPEIQPEINRKPSGLFSSRLGLNREFNRNSTGNFWSNREFNREFQFRPKRLVFFEGDKRGLLPQMF
jgi:hypothetical protein